jgi:hypothetical protein
MYAWSFETFKTRTKLQPRILGVAGLAIAAASQALMHAGQLVFMDSSDSTEHRIDWLSLATVKL